MNSETTKFRRYGAWDKENLEFTKLQETHVRRNREI